MKRYIPALAVVCALFGSVFGTFLEHGAVAARNSSGTYSLPTGNPVVTHTAISSTAFNSTMTDIASELTDSLSRSGKGGMSAPLQLASGSVTNPGLTFTSGTTDGWYRIGSHDIGFAINGLKMAEWTATDGLRGFGTGSGSGVVGITGGATETSGKFAAVTGFSAGSINAAYFESQGTGPALQAVGNTVFGTSGTAITASYGGSYTINFGTINSGSCATPEVTVTGVSVGGVCNVSPDDFYGSTMIPYCAVVGANLVRVIMCNNWSAAQTQGSSSWRIRVWQQ